MQAGLKRFSPRREKDFFSKSSKRFSAKWTAYIAHSSVEEKSCLSVAVKKNAVKHSVDRNKIKRRIREFFQKKIAQGNSPLGSVFVVWKKGSSVNRRDIEEMYVELQKKNS